MRTTGIVHASVHHAEAGRGRQFKSLRIGLRTCRANICSSCSAGTGRECRKPCEWLHFNLRSRLSCSSVSTPSAMAIGLNAEARPMMLETSVPLAGSSGKPLIKVRSIFNRSTGNLDNRPRFEVVVPEKDKDVKSDLRQLRRLNALACMFCRLAHTATNLTPTACASSCPCRASTPKFSGSQWTLMSGIGSESARSPPSISSMSCESSFRRADVDALVIHVGD